MKDVTKIEVLSWCCEALVEGKRKQEGYDFCCVSRDTLESVRGKGDAVPGCWMVCFLEGK